VNWITQLLPNTVLRDAMKIFSIISLDQLILLIVKLAEQNLNYAKLIHLVKTTIVDGKIRFYFSES
jgi:hypothetical protein